MYECGGVFEMNVAFGTQCLWRGGKKRGKMPDYLVERVNRGRKSQSSKMIVSTTAKGGS